MSVMLCPCSFCVALLMYMFVLFVAYWTVFVNYLVKPFAMCLGVVAVLLRILFRQSLHRMSLSGKSAGCTLDRKQYLYFRHLVAGISPNRDWLIVSVSPL